jgi:hypothetical protein
MLDRARATANFRLVVLRGRAYIERIAPAFQTRDLFTIWGILQLLRRYPGRVPDLDLMFDCVDWPVVRADEYQGENATDLPPLFRYCGDNETLDVVFPDWSFWGWYATAPTLLCSCFFFLRIMRIPILFPNKYPCCYSLTMQ